MKVKVNAQKVRAMVMESLEELYRKREMDTPMDGVHMAVEGAIDYLYNEGVLAYEPTQLKKALELGRLDYADICRSALDYIGNSPDFGDDIRGLLSSYPNYPDPTEKEQVEATIRQVVQEFINENPGAFFGLNESELRGYVKEAIGTALSKLVK